MSVNGNPGPLARGESFIEIGPDREVQPVREGVCVRVGRCCQRLYRCIFKRCIRDGRLESNRATVIVQREGTPPPTFEQYEKESKVG